MPRFWKRGAAVVAACAGVAALLMAGGLAPAAEPVVIQPQRVRMFDRGDYAIGVGTHLASLRDLGYEPAPVIKAIRWLGFNSLRDGFAWWPDGPDQGADPAPKLLRVLQAGVGRPLLVLGGQMAGPGSAPLDAASRAAYANFAVRAAGSVMAYHPVFEIWNEWNRTANIKAKAMSDQGAPSDPRYSGRYAVLARSATAAIKSRYPGAQVVIGAAAEDPQWLWLGDVVRQGGLEGADGLSVHLYNQCNRRIRGSDEMLARLRALEGKARAVAGRPVPIYVSEWGWSTGQACPVDSDFVATRSAQFILGAAALPYVKGTWQYELKDESHDPKDMESNFGILDAGYRPKPSTCAVRAATQLLRSIRSIGVAAAPDGMTAILAKTDGGNIAILWDNRGTGTVLPQGGSVKAETLCEASRSFTAGQQIPVGAMPVVLHFASGWPTMRMTGA